MEPDLIKRTTEAINQLNDSYRMDRYLTMAAATASFILLFYIAIRAFAGPNPEVALIVSFFGASGFLTIAIFRLAYFYNDGKKLLTEAVRAEIKRMNGQ